MLMMSWCSVSSRAKPDCRGRNSVWTKAKTALNLHHQLLSWKLGVHLHVVGGENQFHMPIRLIPSLWDTEKPSTESSPNDAPEREVCSASSLGWSDVDLKRPARFLLAMERRIGERREESLQLRNYKWERSCSRDLILTRYCVAVWAQSTKQKRDFNSFPTTSAGGTLKYWFAKCQWYRACSRLRGERRNSAARSRWAWSEAALQPEQGASDKDAPI